MKILYIHGGHKEVAGENIVQTLKNMGHDAAIFSDKPIRIPMLNDDIVGDLEDYIWKNKVELLISLHFIMCVGLAAYQTGIRYISMLWDAPYTELYNPLGRLDNVWVSTFDKRDRERLIEGGMKHVIYQPLSIMPQEVKEWNREIQKTLRGNYIHDISMIGRLYEDNRYDEFLESIPANMQLYFTSIFEEAAFHWDGINRIYGKTSKEILQYIRLVSPEFQISNKQDIEDLRFFEIFYLIRKLANIERITVLNLLAEEHSVKLYTSSEDTESKLINVEIGPPVVYGKATALVYAGSKINLNISLKGIEGGTPLRIMDIMGAGGFVLSSYCEETAELFEEDKEIVMFKTPEELLRKVDYYLTHDRERKQIAKRGHDKVLRCYTYEKKMRQLIDWVTGEK